MRILAFTDIHGSKKAIKQIKTMVKERNPDLIVCCGDVSIFEMDLKKILNDLNKLNKEVILIHGNHEDDQRMKKLCKKYDNLTNVHGSYAIRSDVLFVGYGGDGFSFIDSKLKKMEKTFKPIIKSNKDKKLVFLTHAPPYNTRMDELIGGHCGNKTIRQFIEKYKPKVALCGHIHENFGRKDSIRKTRVLNPGPYGKIIQI